MSGEHLFTLDEAAEILGETASWVRSQAQKLGLHRKGGPWLLTSDEVRRIPVRRIPGEDRRRTAAVVRRQLRRRDEGTPYRQALVMLELEIREALERRRQHRQDAFRLRGSPMSTVYRQRARVEQAVAVRLCRLLRRMRQLGEIGS